MKSVNCELKQEKGKNPICITPKDKCPKAKLKGHFTKNCIDGGINID